MHLRTADSGVRVRGILCSLVLETRKISCLPSHKPAVSTEIVGNQITEVWIESLTVIWVSLPTQPCKNPREERRQVTFIIPNL